MLFLFIPCSEESSV